MKTIEEQVNEESLKRFPIRHKENKKGTGEYDSNLPRRKAFVDGACFALEIENKKNDNNEK